VGRQFFDLGGWMLASNQPILLVLENESDLEEVVRLFIRTGYSVRGYLVGGMKAWRPRVRTGRD